MSGGHLTDYYHDLHRLDEWADKLQPENCLLAEMMIDLHTLLCRYDYYLSGDTGDDVICMAWSKFRDKWLNIDTDQVTELLFEKCLEMVNGAIKGCKNGN